MVGSSTLVFERCTGESMRKVSALSQSTGEACYLLRIRERGPGDNAVVNFEKDHVGG